MNKIKIAVIKRNTYLLFLATINLFLIAASCKKDAPLETNPSKIILGKWEMIEIGKPSDMITVESPSGYKEYLPDSVLHIYDYEYNNPYVLKYWIDTVIHETFDLPTGGAIRNTYILNFKDKNNIIDLELSEPNYMYSHMVYKRIK